MHRLEQVQCEPAALDVERDGQFMAMALIDLSVRILHQLRE